MAKSSRKKVTEPAAKNTSFSLVDCTGEIIHRVIQLVHPNLCLWKIEAIECSLICSHLRTKNLRKKWFFDEKIVISFKINKKMWKVQVCLKVRQPVRRVVPGVVPVVPKIVVPALYQRKLTSFGTTAFRTEFFRYDDFFEIFRWKVRRKTSFDVTKHSENRPVRLRNNARYDSLRWLVQQLALVQRTCGDP